jgi:eukaryotic-like serine/threonine-protein kinase
MSKQTNHFYEFGPFRVDAGRQLLLRDGQPVPLTPKAFETLLVLVQHSEQLVSKDELMKLLWPDTFVEESNLTSHISMLRKALGESPQDHRYLVTMPGRGYRFTQKVRELSDSGELIVESHSIERVTVGETESRGHHAAVVSFARLRRRPWNWILGTAAGVCAIFIVRANFWLASRPLSSLQAQTEMKLRQLTTNPSENPVTNGAISPDGKYLAYTDANGMHIKLLETGETSTVPAPESLKGQDVEWRIIQQWFPDSTRFLADAHPSGESPAFWSSQGSSIWILSVLGGPPHKLRDEATAYSISPDGSSISFGTNKGRLGDREIWLMGPDGENARKLFGADENGAMCCLRWFPHGQRVWFGTNNRPAGDLVTSDLNGGPVTSILPWSVLKKSWEYTLLPDSRLLYLVAESGAAGTSCNYWVLPLDERTGVPADQPRQLTNWSGYCPVNTSVTADGKKLAFLKWIGRNSVYMAELETNGFRLANARLFAPSESLDIPLDWTGDSKGLIYVSNRNGHFEILKQSLDSETSEPLVTGPNDSADARVSPDGSWLLYSVTTLDNLRDSLEVMRVPLSGGPSQLVLSASPFSEFRCARSPSTLCVLAERAGNRKEFTMTAFDPLKGRGAELARIDIHNEAKKFHWDLSPNGTHLCFTRNPRGPIETLSVDKRATQTIHVKDWNNLESLDWDADGEGFFVGSGVHGGMVLLHVDLQGDARVLQKIPGSAALFARPSPDGRHLAFHEFRIEGNLWTMENF